MGENPSTIVILSLGFNLSPVVEESGDLPADVDVEVAVSNDFIMDSQLDVHPALDLQYCDFERLRNLLSDVLPIFCILASEKTLDADA